MVWEKKVLRMPLPELGSKQCSERLGGEGGEEVWRGWGVSKLGVNANDMTHDSTGVK